MLVRKLKGRVVGWRLGMSLWFPFYKFCVFPFLQKLPRFNKIRSSTLSFKSDIGGIVTFSSRLLSPI